MQDPMQEIRRYWSAKRASEKGLIKAHASATRRHEARCAAALAALSPEAKAWLDAYEATHGKTADTQPPPPDAEAAIPEKFFAPATAQPALIVEDKARRRG